MKILFYDTQSYDRESFDRTKEQFPEIEVEYLKTGLAARTASLAKGYDAVCAFVNSDVGTKTVEALHEAGVDRIEKFCRYIKCNLAETTFAGSRGNQAGTF